MWIKPIADGFLLYVLDGGCWKPLIPVDDGGTATPADDESLADSLIGSADDALTASTINGAKAYADGAAANAVDIVTGTASDTSEDLTLYGLKAYIDSKTGGGNVEEPMA